MEFIGQHLPRVGTAAEWAAANPILGEGERAWESDTNREKVGNGVHAYNVIAYEVAHGRTLVASEIPFTPTGTLASTNVQSAIAEAATEGGGGGAGTITSVNGDIGPSVELTAGEVGADPAGTATGLVAMFTQLSIVPLEYNDLTDEYSAPPAVAALGLSISSFRKRWWIGAVLPKDSTGTLSTAWEEGDLYTFTGT